MRVGITYIVGGVIFDVALFRANVLAWWAAVLSCRSVAGLILCALYALTGRLWVPIGIHLAWNLTQGYLFGTIVSGNDLGSSLLLSSARPEAPLRLTGGGTFGPEASVLALILVSTVTVGALGFRRMPGRFAARPKPSQAPDAVSSPSRAARAR